MLISKKVGETAYIINWYRS